MAADAHAMLRSRDFGASSDEEDLNTTTSSMSRSRSQAHARRRDIDEYEYEYEHEHAGAGDGNGQLDSFEDSFNPNGDASESYRAPQPRGDVVGRGKLPNTPALIKSRATSGAGGPAVRDAAGYIKQQGGRGVFGRDDAVNAQDISRSSVGRGYDEEIQDGEHEHGSGLNGDPSFDRSDSQSRILAEEQEKRAANAPQQRTAKNGRNIVPSPTTSTLASTKQATSSKQNLTLREQEKQLDDAKKEVFSLKLKIYFLEERLQQTTPEHVEKALKDHIDLQVLHQNVKDELKRHKRLVQEQTRALEEVGRSQAIQSGRQSRADNDAQQEIQRLKAELEAERERLDEISEDRETYRTQLDEANARAATKDADTENLEREIEALEKENAELRSQTNAQVSMLSAKNEEKEQLYEEIELLKQDVIGLEGELQAAQHNGRNGSPGMEEELNSYRDKFSAAMLDLERREKEIEELNNELNVREEEHEQEIARVTDEWRVALEETRKDKDQLTDALEDREQEIRELDRKLDELDALAQEDHDKLAAALKAAEGKETEIVNLGEEVMGLTDDLQKLGQQIAEMEAEVDEKNAKIGELEKELDAVDRELSDKQVVHSQVIGALKDKLGSSKSRHTELTIQHESLSTEVRFLEGKMEEFALRCAELEEGKRADERNRNRLEQEKEDLEKKVRAKEGELQEAVLRRKRERSELETRWNGIIAEKDQAIGAVRAELRQAQDRLQIREQDLARLNQVLKDVESESKQAGADLTSDKMSAILEVERLNRDLAHYEADLDHARSELERKEEELRQRELEAATLRATNNDVTAQLSVQTQTRLSLSDKLDATTRNLRVAQDELSNAKDRLRVLESQSSKDSRGSTRMTADHRDQLSERNALLQTVYQNIDKIVGSDKRKTGQGDIKPHSNFAVFHDTLMSRLRGISQLQQGFDRRTRDIESRFTDQLSSIKRQQDTRLKQLDKFEISIKSATEAQRQWKQRALLKQSEIDSIKATNLELSNQISSLKTRVNVNDASPGSSHKIQSLSARASTAERRLAATQAQLSETEEKFAHAKEKTATAENQWTARLREMLERQRQLEEKLKRERQGAKERVRELEQSVNELKQHILDANSRSKKLSAVLNRDSDDADTTIRR